MKIRCFGKPIDIKIDIIGESNFEKVIYKNDIIGFYRSYNLKAYIFILVFIVSFITLLFIIFLLAVFAKAIGTIVIAVLNIRV